MGKVLSQTLTFTWAVSQEGLVVRMRAVCLGICFLGASLVVNGGQPAGGEREQRLRLKFEAADLDHDGKLSLRESRKGMPTVARYFNRLDREGKGYLTMEDLLRVRRAGS